MKASIHTLHIANRWGGSGTSVHYTPEDQHTALLNWLIENDGLEGEDADRVRELIAKGKLTEANDLMGELSDASGHEWTLNSTTIETAHLKTAKELEIEIPAQAAGCQEAEDSQPGQSASV